MVADQLLVLGIPWEMLALGLGAEAGIGYPIPVPALMG